MSDTDDPVEIPIEDVLDLHPFRPSEIVDVTLSYLEEARNKGYREVRLIHGKGKGVQRHNIRAALEKLAYVESWSDGGPGGGEWGATVVRLRPLE